MLAAMPGLPRPSRGRPLAALLGAVVLAMPGAAPGATDGMSPQEAILRAKPATVLVVAEVVTQVTLDCGGGPTTVSPAPFRETGTGWFVDPEGWIVTNAHVVQPAHTPPRWLLNQQAQRAVLSACVGDVLARRGLQPGERPDIEEPLKRQALERVLPRSKVEVAPSLFVLLSNGVRLPVKVVKYSPPVATETGPGVMSGRDLALLQAEASDMPSFPVASSHGLKIGDPIRILGFPGVVLTHELLNSSAKVEASVTNGAVSGFKQDVQNQAVIQTDAPAAWGNSGGPAVNQRSEVVGVLTFVSLAPGPEGSLVQGFNFVIPADAVRDFLRDTPVRINGKSPFNEAWFAGLRRLFTEDYAGAVPALREANRLLPDLPDVLRALAEAEDKVKNPPPRPFPWALATAALAGLGVLGLAVAGGQQWKRRRHRIEVGELLALLDAPDAPAVVDARPRAVYARSPYRIPGARHLPPEDLGSGVAELGIDFERRVVAYCASPDERTSARVAQRLRRLGYRRVQVLRGGMGSWLGAGLPLESKSPGGGPGA
jgi:S1-C subfamily serine protease/rhodanese-related sulfurtransferase